jgi:hypothetical protein
MTDPLTGLGIAAANEAAKAGGGVLTRLLGPTMDLMGAQMANAYERRNVRRVVDLADKKSRGDANGAIAPRLASAVLEAAEYADNAMVAEYLSGVLASSRSSDADDRGLAWTALIGRLPTDQMLLHYGLYQETRRLWINRALEATSDISEVRIFVPWWLLLTFFAQSHSGGDPLGASRHADRRLYEAMYGLQHEVLVQKLRHGSAEYLEGWMGTGHPAIDGRDGLIFQPTNRGIGLFLRANGFESSDVTLMTEAGIVFEDLEEKLDPSPSSMEAVLLD